MWRSIGDRDMYSCPSGPHDHGSNASTLCWFGSNMPAAFHILSQVLNMASKCISKLARSQPPSASLNSLDYGLQVRTIMASMCISKLVRSRSRSASLNSLDHGLQVYLQIRSITASKCISKLARSRPRSVSLSSLDRHFQAHLELLSSTACSQSRYTVFDG